MTQKKKSVQYLNDVLPCDIQDMDKKEVKKHLFKGRVNPIRANKEERIVGFDMVPNTSGDQRKRRKRVLVVHRSWDNKFPLTTYTVSTAIDKADKHGGYIGMNRDTLLSCSFYREGLNTGSGKPTSSLVWKDPSEIRVDKGSEVLQMQNNGIFGRICKNAPVSKRSKEPNISMFSSMTREEILDLYMRSDQKEREFLEKLFDKIDFGSEIVQADLSKFDDKNVMGLIKIQGPREVFKRKEKDGSITVSIEKKSSK